MFQEQQNITLTVSCTLSELYCGCRKRFLLNRYVICKSCKGTGVINQKYIKQCRGCDGEGSQIHRYLMRGVMFKDKKICENCKGMGEEVMEKDFCKICYGNRVVPEKKIIELYIEKGSHNKQKIVFPRMGNEVPPLKRSTNKSNSLFSFFSSSPSISSTITYSDIVFVINQLPHISYIRGNLQNVPSDSISSIHNLHINLDISISQSLCGYSEVISTLDNRKLLINSANFKSGKKKIKNDEKDNIIIKDGDVFWIRGEGMPLLDGSKSKGDLFVHFRVVFPKKGGLSKDQKELLSKVFNVQLPDRMAVPTSSSSYCGAGDDEYEYELEGD
jgi:DnaJ family protein A protein 2